MKKTSTISHETPLTCELTDQTASVGIVENFNGSQSISRHTTESRCFSSDDEESIPAGLFSTSRRLATSRNVTLEAVNAKVYVYSTLISGTPQFHFKFYSRVYKLVLCMISYFKSISYFILINYFKS